MNGENEITDPSRRRWRRTRFLFVVAGLAVGLGGCAGSDDSTADPVDEPELTEPEPTDVVEASVVEDELESSSGTEAQEGEPDEEFIDLPYWDVHVLDGSFDFQIDREGCDASEPGVEVCDWEMNLVFIGSIFGRATTHTEGTVTVESDGCSVADGTTGDLSTLRGAGTITTLWGDEAYITTFSGRCAGTDAVIPSTWRVTGGTGRFEDATGLMNTENAQFGNEENSVYVQSLSTGTITVRADLWKDWLPAE